MRFVTVDDLNPFISCSVDMGADQYDAGTTYAAGNRVWVPGPQNWGAGDLGQSYIYQSIQNDNTGQNPSSSPTFWTKVGPTNRWGMRDAYSGQVSSSTSDIVFEIRTASAPYEAHIGIIGVGFCVGSSVSVEVVSHSGVVEGAEYSGPVVYQLGNDHVAMTEPRWNASFGTLEKGETKNAFIQLDGVYINPVIRVTINKGSSYKAQCGAVGWGFGGARYTVTRYGVSISLTDYSRKEVNEFGVVELVKRPYAPKISLSMEVPETYVDQLVSFFGALRARMVYWDFNNSLDDNYSAYGQYSALGIIGTYSEMTFELVAYEEYVVNLTVEGAI